MKIDHRGKGRKGLATAMCTPACGTCVEHSVALIVIITAVVMGVTQVVVHRAP